jgi:hypothetical protein
MHGQHVIFGRADLAGQSTSCFPGIGVDTGKKELFYSDWNETYVLFSSIESKFFITVRLSD